MVWLNLAQRVVERFLLIGPYEAILRPCECKRFYKLWKVRKFALFIVCGGPAALEPDPSKTNRSSAYVSSPPCGATETDASQCAQASAQANPSFSLLDSQKQRETGLLLISLFYVFLFAHMVLQAWMWYIVSSM